MLPKMCFQLNLFNVQSSQPAFSVILHGRAVGNRIGKRADFGRLVKPITNKGVGADYARHILSTRNPGF